MSIYLIFFRNCFNGTGHYFRLTGLSFFLLMTVLSCLKAELSGVNPEYLASSERPIEDFFQASRHSMVSTDSMVATEVGYNVLQQGGNAFDAFFAITFAISVHRPQSTGIGGGGFALLYDADSKVTEAVDFRERAPLQASQNMYIMADGSVDRQSAITGTRSIAVPGNVAGAFAIHEKYGTVPASELMQYAIDLAKNGFEVYDHLAMSFERTHESMNPAMREVFAPNASPLTEGSLLVQADLARTLELLVEHGPQIFYDENGQIARQMAGYLQANQGIISEQDLSAYEVYFEKPETGHYRNFQIATMPLPSSGKFILEMFQEVERYDLNDLYENDRRQYLSIIIEAMRNGFENRAFEGGDIRSPNTTHFVVQDRYGNTISSTQSVNWFLGSRIMIPETGIVMNNTMDDFVIAPDTPNVWELIGGPSNFIRPGATPLSSMAPTIAFHRGQPYLAIGASGGSQIPSAIFLSMIHEMDLNYSIYESIAHGRIHHQFYPDKVYLENTVETYTEDLDTAYENIEMHSNRAKVFAILKKNGSLIGAADPRGDGLVRGQ